MYDSPRYRTNLEDALEFVNGQHHGTLIAAPPGGWPQATLVPFAKDGDRIWIHCVRADPACEALERNPRATFLVSDFLAFTPHHWVDPSDASQATLHFRAVAFECDAHVSLEPAVVAETLRRILMRYEPGASYDPLENGERYGHHLRRLAAVRLDVVAIRAKFKAGPYGPPELKERVAAHLGERGEPQ